MGPKGGADIHFHSPQPDTAYSAGPRLRIAWCECLHPGFYTGTNLYCLVTEAHGCEQLA